MDDEPQPALVKRERREQHRLARDAAAVQAHRRRRVKAVVTAAAALTVVGAVGYGMWRAANRSTVPAQEVVARGSVHWHPELRIFIKGVEQSIPQNIGIGITHETVHTHDDPPTIHLEMLGVVTAADTKLGRFFRVWGKRFDRECILDFCNGDDGTVKFFVNGQANDEFENYRMRDGDTIEIRYE